MGRKQVVDAALHHRSRFIFQDPVRFSCLLSALLLMFLPIWNPLLTLFVVAVVQFSVLALILRFSMTGWSYRWGKRVHSTILASSMCLDWVYLSACAVVGAMLLMRYFGGSAGIQSLGFLAIGICLLPDIRIYRLLFDADPIRQNEHLQTGYFWRDPVKMGAILSVFVMCEIDRGVLPYLILSLIFLQFNSLVVMVDKYAQEIEAKQWRGWGVLMFEREGSRFLFCLSPLALLPIRYFLGDKLSYLCATIVAGLIIFPDLARLAWNGVHLAWGAMTGTLPKEQADETRFISVIQESDPEPSAAKS